jgi:hypothetical protein
VYNVYVKIINTASPLKDEDYWDVDKISSLTDYSEGVVLFIIQGGTFSTHVKLKDLISSIGQAKKISEQNNISVILDLTGQVPKIEKL